MNFEFSAINSPLPAPSLALRAVFWVHSDPSYDVSKHDTRTRDIVALRTTGGRGRVTIEGCEELFVTPGTLMFFEHSKVRRYYCADETWNFWWFEFGSDEMLSLPLNRLYTIEPVEGEQESLAACLELLGKAGPGMARLASASFSLLFYRWMLQIDSGRRENPHFETVENAINLMRQNLSRHVSVQELAHACGLSERRFRQVFTEIAGMQPKKFEDALRIRTAEELLLNTPCTIGEIALRLGYSNQFHFCKAFRSARGMPPSAFRSKGT